jgi:XTP/dITP diphosphohydrolase
MKKLLIATKNPGKFREYRIIFKDFLKLNFDLVSLNDLGIKENIDEKGKIYKENAILKAKFYCKLSGLPTLADDSGLEIEILNGWPGIKSRRAGKDGKEKPDEKLIKIVMEKLKDIPFEKRKAKYKVVIALAIPNKNKIYSFGGERKGFIAQKASKKMWKGFPYDSIFYLPEKKKVFVELTPKEKAYFSHRKVALEKALPILKTFLL